MTSPPTWRFSSAGQPCGKGGSGALEGKGSCKAYLAEETKLPDHMRMNLTRIPGSDSPSLHGFLCELSRVKHGEDIVNSKQYPRSYPPLLCLNWDFQSKRRITGTTSPGACEGSGLGSERVGPTKLPKAPRALEGACTRSLVSLSLLSGVPAMPLPRRPPWLALV